MALAIQDLIGEPGRIGLTHRAPRVAHMGALGLGLALAACAFATLAPAAEVDERSSDAELASFRLADSELEIVLVASEPRVVSPVDIAWDARGRCYVVEMIDYPKGPGAGRVALLQDSDQDGLYETSRTFADNLSFPTSVLPWKDGLFVSAAPDLLYLRDTNQDGRADAREVVWTGFGEGNQQLRVNGLFWGLDHWIYGANGRSDGSVMRPGIEGSPISLRGRDFRFQPETDRFEALSGRSQFGVTRNDWGERFLSWNTIPIRHEIIPLALFETNTLLASEAGLSPLLPAGDDGRVYPVTPAPLTFNQESTMHFNALAGLTMYRGDALGQRYYGDMFVGETLRNLVHRRKLKEAGVTYVAERVETNTEFLVSTDPWFHPVNFETGPDGALYVVDFYRRFVEHPDYVPSQAREGVAWREGDHYGRIWKVRRKEGPAATRLDWPGGASKKEWMSMLQRTNGWWRDTVHRLLVEEHAPDSARMVRELWTSSSNTFARIHALWILEGLNALDERTLRQGAEDPHPRVRRQALRLMQHHPEWQSALDQARGNMAADPDPGVRLEYLFGLARAPVPPPPALESLIRGATNEWLALAFKLSQACWTPGWWTNELHGNPDLGAIHDRRSALDMLSHAATWTGFAAPSEVVWACRDVVASFLESEDPSRKAIATAATLDSGLQWGAARRAPRLLLPLVDPRDAKLLNWAENAILADDAPLAWRVTAAGLLCRSSRPDSIDRVIGLLETPQPPDVRNAVLRALFDLGNPSAAATLYARWNRYDRALRRQILRLTPSSPSAMSALIRQLQSHQIPIAEIDLPSRQALLNTPHEDWRRILEDQFRESQPVSREAAVERFSTALGLEGDPASGGRLFAEHCLTCHTLLGKGHHVGPDLSGLASRPAETILSDILDPNRSVAPEYVAYTILSSDGEAWTGVLAEETPARVSVRRAGLPPEVIARSRILALQAEGLSLMPEGLEALWTPRQLADLLAFLRAPEAGLLPP